MKILNRVKGITGEELAVRYLKKRKYKIVERNYTCHLGEIDIVAKQDNTIVFIEVKSRNNAEYGMPYEAVNLIKQRKIINCVKHYMAVNQLYNTQVRFDCISILNGEITHIIDAFWAD